LDELCDDRDVPYSADQMRGMILQLTHAGLLLPKRHIGPGGNDDDGRDCGYWFSLPGLGRAARSVESGRADVLNRLRRCPNGEKRRTALERDIERSIAGRGAWRGCDGGDDGTHRRMSRGDERTRYAQSGKFVVMDMLAKGWIRIHEIYTGEHFVRLTE
jgi:hypothetical protein